MYCRINVANRDRRQESIKTNTKNKKDCVEFSQLTVGSKAKAADQLYTENRVLKELCVLLKLLREWMKILN
jgi:hypothetical protein